MKRVFLFVFKAVVASHSLLAQRDVYKSDHEIEYGRIPDNDLKMEVYAPDTTADAVVLEKKTQIRLDTDDRTSIWESEFKVISHHFKRVKLLKKSAFDREGNFEVSFYAKSKWYIFRDVKASVIQSSGERYILTDKEFFEEKTGSGYKTFKFAFPKLKEGSIIEYEYDIVSDNIGSLPTFYFQESIPVRHAEVTVTIPGYYSYAFIPRGNQKIKFDSLPKERSAFDELIYIVKRKFYTDLVPAFKEEAYVPSLNDYISNMQFELVKITNPRNPDKHFIEFATTWEKAAEYLILHERLGRQFMKRSNYKDVWSAVEPLIGNIKDYDAKIKIVYDYLNNNISTTPYQTIFCDDDLNAAFKKKKALPSELNMMLIACLNEAGMNAKALLVSSRSNGKPILIRPFTDQFDHVLCYVDRGDKSIILDAGNKFRPVGTLRTDALNEQGWLLDDKNPEWKLITPQSSVFNLLVNFKFEPENVLTGSYASSSKGYAAYFERTEESELENSEKFKKELQAAYSDIKIDNITIENLKKVDEPFKRNALFKIKNGANYADNLLVFKPTEFVKDFKTNPFKLSKREYPIEFNYPTKDQYVFNVTIPEGYVVDEMPKSIIHNLPSKAGSFQYISSVTATVIQVVVKLQINQLVYQPEDYATVKDFFNQIANKLSEQIVLKKK